MAALRAPEGGCPWDLEQTLETLRPYLLEEAYEVLEVMGRDDAEAHCDELGDLLFQVVFQSQLRAEQGAFGLADVVDAIADKLERRHPHVFGDEDARDAGAVAARWDELKRAEGKGGVEDVPQALPALMRAAKVGRRASKAGFDWPDLRGPVSALRAELAELEEAIASGDEAAARRELGDLLFSAVNVARHLEADPELELRASTDRFVARLRHVTAALRSRGLEAAGADPEQLDALWQAAKEATSGRPA
ncbi:MAG: nucleoside triphosphate pyrophosphohydrolase [Deltaproteobacteria bacterium]|nr:nucleoside triphosphate pyrophosphohydrolase [Deltaproteobacteria bacterium]